MRPSNSNSFSYQAGDPPSDPAGLQKFLREELAKIAATFNALAAGHLDKTYVAPTKPRDGDVRYADGTSWNPASGAGVYYFNGTIWKLLG